MIEGSIKCEGEAEPVSLFFQWDEFCDLLGGASWEHAFQRWQATGLSPERKRTLGALSSQFTNVHQFLFENNGKYLPLEVFWLKWNLFTALCRKLHALHNTHQRPHLGLDPARVLIQCPLPVDSWLPVRWLFSVQLLESNGASSFVHEGMPVEMADSLLTPPPVLDPHFIAPCMHEWPLGREIPVTVLIRSLDRLQENAEGVVSGMLRVHILSDAIANADFSGWDVFRLTVPLSSGDSRVIRLWARKVDVVERGLVVSGVVDPLPVSAWTDLERASRQVFSQASAIVYRAFHVPCDLYSLGMLLIRALLVNQDRTIEKVEQALFPVVRALHPVVQGLDPFNSSILHRRISARLKEEGQIFSSDSVLFRRDENQMTDPALTDELWYDAMTLALRLITWIPGFSLCQSMGEYDGKRVGSFIERVTREAEHLGERIVIELYGSHQRNRDIRKACDLLRAELV